jgi:hypothetical protein
MVLELAIIEMGDQGSFFGTGSYFAPPTIEDLSFQLFKLLGDHRNLGYE